MSNIELAKPRDFGEIINDTFTFTRQNFKPLLKYFFIFCGFFMLASAGTAVITQLNMVRAVNNFNPNSYETSNRFAAFSFLTPAYFLSMLFLILEFIAIATTVLCYAALYKQKGNAVPDTDEMWGFFKFYFLKLLGSGIVIGIVVFVGLMLCIIPGIYLYPAMSIVFTIMVMENTSFGYAFNHSFRLIKDNWWATFGVLVVMAIIVGVASMVVTIPAALINAANIFLHIGKGPASISIIATIVTVFLTQLGYIFHILTTVASVMIYFNLTESKEGTGLLERMNQFGSKGPDTSTTPEEY